MPPQGVLLGIENELNLQKCRLPVIRFCTHEYMAVRIRQALIEHNRLSPIPVIRYSTISMPSPIAGGISPSYHTFKENPDLIRIWAYCVALLCLFV